MLKTVTINGTTISYPAGCALAIDAAGVVSILLPDPTAEFEVFPRLVAPSDQVERPRSATPEAFDETRFSDEFSTSAQRQCVAWANWFFEMLDAPDVDTWLSTGWLYEHYRRYATERGVSLVPSMSICTFGKRLSQMLGRCTKQSVVKEQKRQNGYVIIGDSRAMRAKFKAKFGWLPREQQHWLDTRVETEADQNRERLRLARRDLRNQRLLHDSAVKLDTLVDTGAIASPRSKIVLGVPCKKCSHTQYYRNHHCVECERLKRVADLHVEKRLHTN